MPTVGRSVEAAPPARSHVLHGRDYRRRHPTTTTQAWRDEAVDLETKRNSASIAMLVRVDGKRPSRRRPRNQLGLFSVADVHEQRHQERSFKPLKSRDCYYRNKDSSSEAAVRVITPDRRTNEKYRPYDGDRSTKVAKHNVHDTSAIDESEMGKEWLALRDPSSGCGSHRSKVQTRVRSTLSSLPRRTFDDLMSSATRDRSEGGRRGWWSAKGAEPETGYRFGQRRNNYQRQKQQQVLEDGIRRDCAFSDEQADPCTGRRRIEREEYSHQRQAPRDAKYDGHIAIPIRLPSPSTASSLPGLKPEALDSISDQPAFQSEAFGSSMQHDRDRSPTPFASLSAEGVSISKQNHRLRSSSPAIPSSDDPQKRRCSGRAYVTREGLGARGGTSDVGSPMPMRATTYRFSESEGDSPRGNVPVVESDAFAGQTVTSPTLYYKASAEKRGIALGDREQVVGEEDTRYTQVALAFVEERARQEVEMAQAGAETERCARVAAEESLSDARRKLEQARGMLEEKLADGSTAALSALLAEKEEAEAKAKDAIEGAAAAAASADQEAKSVNILSQKAEGAEAKRRVAELKRANIEYEEVQKNLVEERQAGNDRDLEYRRALTEARREASACRGRAAALQTRLEQADVPGLQDKLASLTSEKAAAQARTAELETKLTRATDERRKRMTTSREARQLAAERLSTAESRASAAEARVEAVGRQLTVSEQRLRQAEQTAAMATTSTAGIASSVREMAGCALSLADANARTKGEAGGGEFGVENTWLPVWSATQKTMSKCEQADAARHLEIVTTAAQRLAEQKVAAEQRAADLERALTDAHRKLDVGSDVCTWPNDSPLMNHEHHPAISQPNAGRQREEAMAADAMEYLTREKKAVDARVAELENLLVDAYYRIRLLEETHANGEIVDGDKNAKNRKATRTDEIDMLRLADDERRRSEAEAEAGGLRAELDRANAQALTTAVEVAQERMQAAREAEELSRELQSTEQEVFGLRVALAAATRETEVVKYRLESRLHKMMSSHDEEAAGNAKVALVALLEEKADLETQAADFTREANVIREKLERDLKAALEAACAAEAEVETVRIRFERGTIAARQEHEVHCVREGAMISSHGSEAVEMASADVEQVTQDTKITYRVSTNNSEPWCKDDGEQITSAEAELRLAKTASEKAWADTEALRRDLDQVKKENVQAIERGQAAEGRVVELEFGILEAEKEYALFKERAESRLEVLKLSFEQEEQEGATQGALVALLEEKAVVEACAVRLEQEVVRVKESARAAKTHSAHLKADFERRVMAEHSDEADALRVTHEEKVAAAVRRASKAEESLETAKEASRSAREGYNHLQVELNRMRTAEQAAVEGRRLAEARIVELEKVFEVAEIEQERLHARTELRLDALRRGLEEEESEGAVQDALTCLLVEKAEAEKRTAELKRQLLEVEQEHALSKRNLDDQSLSSTQRNLHPLADAAGSVGNASTSAAATTVDEAATDALLGNTVKVACENTTADEVVDLCAELDSAPSKHEYVTATAVKESDVVERRFSRLEGLVEDVARDCAKHREPTERKLEPPVKGFDGEQEGRGTKAVLVALPDERAQANRRAAEVSSPPTVLTDASGASAKVVNAHRQAELSHSDASTTQEAQRRPDSENAVRDAEHAVLKAKREVDSLLRDLDGARATEAASCIQRRISDERVAELERAIDAKERDHKLFRERADARLNNLKRVFDEEDGESGVQAALTALLDEKAEMESENVRIAQLADHVRIELETRLQNTKDTLRTSEAKAGGLLAELDETRNAGRVAAKTTANNISSADEAAAQRRACAAEAALQNAKAASESAKREIESQKKQLDLARMTEADAAATFAKEKKTAEDRIAAMQEANESISRDREAMKARAESRLEAIGEAFEQQQEENAAQLALAALLDEKASLERRAVDAEDQLKEASEKACVAETNARILQAELGRAMTQAPEGSRSGKREESGDSKGIAAVTRADVAKVNDAAREAREALQKSRAEVETFRAEIELSRNAELKAIEAAEAEKRAAQARAIELEGIIEQTEREQAQFRSTTESRLEQLRLQLEAEESERESQQESFAALLEEKGRAEDAADNLRRALVDTRATLEDRLHDATDAVQAAELRAETLQADLCQATIDVADKAKHGQLVETENLAAAATSAAAFAEALTVATDKAAQVATTKAMEAAAADQKVAVGVAVRDAEVATRMLQKELQAVQENLEGARAAGAVTLKERDTARGEVSALQLAMEKAEREHRRSRERAETRLESLRLAADEEERESGAQAVMECLLEEKTAAVRQATELEQELAHAFDVARNAEATVTTLTAELNRVERDADDRALTAAAGVRASTVEMESSAAERVAAAEAAVLEAELTSRASEEEVRSLRTQLQRARELASAVEARASEEEIVAQERISHLEGIVRNAVDEHGSLQERIGSRLEGLRAAIEQEEQEGNAPAAIAALLDEKCSAELRVADLERRVEESNQAVRTAEARAEALTVELERSRERTGDHRNLPAVNGKTESSVDEKVGSNKAIMPVSGNGMYLKPAAENSTVESAATARASEAETALKEALEAAEEVQSRCALAQERESRAERESAWRVEELTRELEEATQNGPKAALIALLKQNETTKATAEGKEATRNRELEAEDRERSPTAEAIGVTSASGTASETVPVQLNSDGGLEEKTDHQTNQVEINTDANDGSDADDSFQSSGGQSYTGAVMELLAERDHLLREGERLGKVAEDAICLQQDEAYKRTIGVGRYEFTLDAVEEELADTRETLAEAQAALDRSGVDAQLEDRFRIMCERVKHAEDGRKRADEQLMETREQLYHASRIFEQESCRSTIDREVVHAPSVVLQIPPNDENDSGKQKNQIAANSVGGACSECRDTTQEDVTGNILHNLCYEEIDAPGSIGCNGMTESEENTRGVNDLWLLREQERRGLKGHADHQEMRDCKGAASDLCSTSNGNTELDVMKDDTDGTVRYLFAVDGVDDDASKAADDRDGAAQGTMGVGAVSVITTCATEVRKPFENNVNKVAQDQIAGFIADDCAARAIMGLKESQGLLELRHNLAAGASKYDHGNTLPANAKEGYGVADSAEDSAHAAEDMDPELRSNATCLSAIEQSTQPEDALTALGSPETVKMLLPSCPTQSLHHSSVFVAERKKGDHNASAIGGWNPKSCAGLLERMSSFGSSRVTQKISARSASEKGVETSPPVMALARTTTKGVGRRGRDNTGGTAQSKPNKVHSLKRRTKLVEDDRCRSSLGRSESHSADGTSTSQRKNSDGVSPPDCSSRERTGHDETCARQDAETDRKENTRGQSVYLSSEGQNRVEGLVRSESPPARGTATESGWCGDEGGGVVVQRPRSESPGARA